ncbi:hypothetical protein GJV04_20335 [Enterobacteriaceae bacterium RIT714]|nr:hypothetical protein [Enterobacteriaceae bacterium RIT714]
MRFNHFFIWYHSVQVTFSGATGEMTFNISTIAVRADSANTTEALYGDAPESTYTAISKDMPLNRANPFTVAGHVFNPVSGTRNLAKLPARNFVQRLECDYPGQTTAAIEVVAVSIYGGHSPVVADNINQHISGVFIPDEFRDRFSRSRCRTRFLLQHDKRVILYLPIRCPF